MISEPQQIPMKKVVQSLSISRSDDFFIVGGIGFIARFSYPEIAKTHYKDITMDIWDSAISSDNQRVFLGDWNDKGVSIFSTNDIEKIGSISFLRSGLLSFCMLDRVGVLLAGLKSSEIILVDETSLNEVHRIKHHTNWVRALVAPSGQRTFFSGGADRLVAHWSVESPRLLGSFSIENKVHSLAISPDQRQLFVGDTLGSVYEFNAATYSLIRGFTGLHSRPVSALLAASDGRGILSCSEDNKIRWVFSKTIFSEKHTNSVRRIAAIGGNCLVSISADETILLSPISIGPPISTSNEGSLLQAKRAVQRCAEQLNDLLFRELDLVELQTLFAEILRKNSAPLSAMPSLDVFKGTILKAKPHGKCLNLLAPSPMSLFKGNYNKGKIEGKGFIIKPGHILKTNFVEGKPDPFSPSEIYIPSKQIRLCGCLDPQNTEDISGFRVAEALKNAIRIVASNGTFFSMEELSGKGTIYFSNGCIEGFIKNGELDIGAINEKSPLVVDGKQYKIFSINSKGVIVTTNFKLFSCDYHLGTIVPVDINDID